MCLGGVKAAMPPPPPPPPQTAKAPETVPLRKRNAPAGSGFVMPQGSTMLTGPSGISTAQLNLGSSTLLGGGKPGGG